MELLPPKRECGVKSDRLLEEQDCGALTQVALAGDVALSWVIVQAVRQFIERTQEPGAKTEKKPDARKTKSK